jgi:hypothetical protein
MGYNTSRANLELGLSGNLSNEKITEIISSILKVLLELMGTIDILLSSNLKILDTGNVELQRVVLNHVSTSVTVVGNLTPTVGSKGFYRNNKSKRVRTHDA